MRDAYVFAKEGNLIEAINLWKKNFETKKGKQKLYSAYNIAMGYEMQDNLESATEWALKAQLIAHEINNIDKKEISKINDGTISYYLLISLYVDELQKRKDGLTRLNAQMSRFQE